jgi:hypothetical protein
MDIEKRASDDIKKLEGIYAPTGVHYPLLVEEINEAIKPGEKLPEAAASDLLDYLWDVFLEEGGKEGPLAVRLTLQLQEARIKVAAGQMTDRTADKKLTETERQIKSIEKNRAIHRH